MSNGQSFLSTLFDSFVEIGAAATPTFNLIERFDEVFGNARGQEDLIRDLAYRNNDIHDMLPSIVVPIAQAADAPTADVIVAVGMTLSGDAPARAKPRRLSWADFERLPAISVKSADAAVDFL